MNVKLLKFIIRMSKMAIYATVICFSLTMVYGHESAAQRKYLKEIPLELTYQGESLLELIEEIEEHTQFKFAYSRSALKNKKVSLTAGNWNMDQLLRTISVQAEVSLKRINETITIKEVEEEDDLPVVSEYVSIQQQVSGKITDENDEPLPGATIVEKGTSNGTVTDIEGNFSLQVDDDAVLLISFVGYQTQEVSVAGRTSFNIQMVPDMSSLEEVVVVGYSTQEKASITGSVASVEAEELIKRPAPNSANLVQGRVPGLRVTQSSAEPGRDNPDFLIRGRGTFGGSNSPLILIDGVTGSFNNLAPDDIESVTVLKDAASASIYGARAANGVILVTTKKGQKGDLSINYRANFSLHEATKTPDFITNSAEYMTLYNEAAERSGIAFKYPQLEIRKYANATDRKTYPNFDYVDHYFGLAPVHNHNLSFSGGSDRSTYKLSLNYLNQEAIIPGYDFSRYNALLNYTTQVSDKINVGTIMNLTYKDRKEPPIISQYMILAIYAAGPTYGPFLPDGSGRVVSRAYRNEGKNRNPQEHYLMGNQRTQEYNLNAQAFVDIDLFPGLTWSTKVAVNYVDEFFKMHQKPYEAFILHERTDDGDYAPFTFGPDVLGVSDFYQKEITPTVYSTFKYTKKIANAHNLNVLLGYEQVSYKRHGLSARRINSPDPDISELSGYSEDGQSIFPEATRLPNPVSPQEWALQSLFGRVSYDYNGKYLFEGNLRYDGTSRVSPDYRWGVFPSFSVGWLMSEEPFIRDNFSWIEILKLRGSYGVLGNQNVGTYLYQNNLVVDGINYSFDNDGLEQGAVINQFRDQRLRWESTRILDLGLDLDIYRGILGVSFDWFRKTTYDILASQPVPSSLGLGAPTLNDGIMQNTGVELELTHQNRIGDLTYGANLIGSTAKNELIHIRVPNYGSTIDEEGLPFGSHYLYEWDGIFQVEDIGDPNVPVHEANPNPQPGDLKMKDQNGDGVIDGDDRIVVDGAYPDFTYSFGFNVGYKNFQFSAFFQGLQGLKSRVFGWGIDPFTQGTPPTKKWRNAWTEENRSNTLPAIYIAGYPGVSNYQASTFYLQDASYLRLKNIMLSYSLPKTLVSRINADDITVYVSGDNLLTFTQYEGADPEREDITGNFAQYPQVRIYNVGLTLKF